jgi:hypothetical protein
VPKSKERENLMSTRGAIIFVGPHTSGGGIKATRLYQHCDTYPTNMLPALRNVLRVARKTIEDYDRVRHPERYTSGREFNFHTVEIPTDLLVGKYIGETTDGYGMSARLEKSIMLQTNALESWDALTREGIFGLQSDIEWVYLVDTFERSIRIFGGGYTDKAPYELVNEIVDPMSYVTCLLPDYAEREAKRITSAVRSLKRLGFPVNPQRKSGRRAAHAAQRAKKNN